MKRKGESGEEKKKEIAQTEGKERRLTNKRKENYYIKFKDTVHSIVYHIR